MTPHYQDDLVTLYAGDCLDVLRELPDGSVDAVVTDPPYGLEFMGKDWDAFRLDDPGTSRHRGDRAGKHGQAAEDEGRGAFGRVAYGGGKRPTTYRCVTCGKRDQFRNDHGCGQSADWRKEIIDPHAAPPSMLAFGEWSRQWAAECLRVLKPGGHLLAFGGTRTWHRLACAIEDAGFEVRDSIAWMYGSGFPKSLDVSKAIDKARTDREWSEHAAVARWLVDRMNERGVSRADVSAHFDAANVAQQWTTHWIDGAVKPRVPRWEQWHELRRWLDLPADMDDEVWRLNCRKGQPGEAWQQRPVTGVHEQPTAQQAWMQNYSDHVALPPKDRRDIPATDAARQWQGWGTALKPAHEPIVVARKPLTGTVAANVLEHGTGALNIDGCRIGTEGGTTKGNPPKGSSNGIYGDGINGACDIVPLNAGRWPANVVLDEHQAAELDRQSGDDVGGASRFFYTAKAGTHERPRVDGVAHPTVKPVDLMRWLVRLVTPPGGTVLEPFAGSGTTAEACVIEGFHCIAIEREADYLPLIVQRLSRPIQPTLGDL